MLKIGAGKIIMEKISDDFKMSFHQEMYDYRLVVIPEKQVYEQVIAEQNSFFKSYQPDVQIATKPHISIARFSAWEHMEATIVNRLQVLFKAEKNFTLRLNNYSALPEHAVFIRVQDADPLRQLSVRLEAIKPYIKEQSSPAGFMYYPSMYIADHLPVAVYQHAIRDYSKKDFSASFVVSELALLRRKNIHDEWKQVSIFRFRPNEYNK